MPGPRGKYLQVSNGVVAVGGWGRHAALSDSELDDCWDAWLSGAADVCCAVAAPSNSRSEVNPMPTPSRLISLPLRGLRCERPLSAYCKLKISVPKPSVCLNARGSPNRKDSCFEQES